MKRLAVAIALAACSAPAPAGPVAPTTVPWCAWATMLIPGGQERMQLCTETQAICQWAVGRARRYGSMVEITRVATCHERR